MSVPKQHGLAELAFIAAHPTASSPTGGCGADTVEGYAAACAECQFAANALTLAGALVATAGGPELPSGDARARLLAAVDHHERYAPFAGRVAALFDVDVRAIELALASLTNPNAWRAARIDGTSICDVSSPANARGAQTMFVRVEAGTTFPRHGHFGEERLLVLDGTFEPDDGAPAAPGDARVYGADAVHEFHVPATGPCICAYRVERGVFFVDASASDAPRDASGAANGAAW